MSIISDWLLCMFGLSTCHTLGMWLLFSIVHHIAITLRNTKLLLNSSRLFLLHDKKRTISDSHKVNTTFALMCLYGTFCLCIFSFHAPGKPNSFLGPFFCLSEGKKIWALKLAGEEADINQFSISLQGFAYSLHSLIIQNQQSFIGCQLLTIKYI